MYHLMFQSTLPTRAATSHSKGIDTLQVFQCDIVSKRREWNKNRAVVELSGDDMKRFTVVLFLLITYAVGGRSELVTSSLHASLDTGGLAFTLLGVQFTSQDIFQGGQVIFHD